MPNFGQNQLNYQSNNLSLKAALHCGFLVVGIITVLLGQVLPFLAVRLSLNDEQSGSFFAAQFGGSIVGTMATGWLLKNIGSARTLGAAFLLFAAGVGGLNFDSFSLCWWSALIYGVGVGLAIPTTLLSTAALSQNNTTAVLNLMSFVWGVGAIVSQPFVGVFGRGGLIVPTVLLAALSLIFAIVFLMFFRNIEPTATALPQQESDLVTEPAQSPRVWSNPAAWLITAFGFFDVGIESGVSGWLTSYTLRSDLPPELSWLSATPIFFFFFVAGRGIAAILARVWSNNQIIWVSLCITLIGTISLCLATSWQLIFLSAAILGIGLAAVFPTNMARFTQTFGAGANHKTVPLFVMGSIGSITITWLIGYLSSAFNDLRAGLVVLLIAAIALLFLQTIFQKRSTAVRGGNVFK